MYLSWDKNGKMDLTKTHGIDMDSWYRIRFRVQTWTHGLDMDSWHRHGLMVLAKTHGMDTPMVLTKTHGLVSVLLNHTHRRGPSVSRMLDFFFTEPTPMLG